MSVDVPLEERCRFCPSAPRLTVTPTEMTRMGTHGGADAKVSSGWPAAAARRGTECRPFVELHICLKYALQIQSLRRRSCLHLVTKRDQGCLHTQALSCYPAVVCPPGKQDSLWGCGSSSAICHLAQQGSSHHNHGYRFCTVCINIGAKPLGA
eukprot:1150773-Pelagomonas_calceolata.AAC.8